MTLAHVASSARGAAVGWPLSVALAGCAGGGTRRAEPSPEAGSAETGPCASLADADADAGVLSHAVLTQHNDIARTGATLAETVLSTCNVPGLRQLGAYSVDGEVYAQPLYAESVATQGGTKNLPRDSSVSMPAPTCRWS